MFEPLLNFRNWFMLLHLGKLIFLYQNMVPNSLHIISFLMCDFKYILISFALLYWETLKNLSMFNEEVRMLFLVQSYWESFLSSSVQRFHGLPRYLLSITCLGMNGPFIIAFQIHFSIGSMKILIQIFQNW